MGLVLFVDPAFRRSVLVRVRKLVPLSLIGVYALCIAALGLLVDANDLVDTLDKSVNDYRIALLSPRATTQRDDILVVMIDENTLQDYSVISPVSRTLLAKIIDRLDEAKPKLVAVDIVFDRPTSDTSILIDAIKRFHNAPLVLGAVDKRLPRISSESLAFQDQFLRAVGRPAGHLLFEHKSEMLAGINDTIRYTAEAGPEPLAQDSFADVIAASADYQSHTMVQQIAWQLAPSNTAYPLYRILRIRRHDPAKLDGDYPEVMPDWWNEVVRNRIVIIGQDLADRDQHMTPLSVVTRDTMPGVLIHAQAVAQRIDASTGHSRDLVEVEPSALFICMVLVTFIVFIVTTQFEHERHKWRIELAELFLIFGSSTVTFWVWHLDFPSGALAFAWGAAVTGAHNSKSLREMLAKRFG